MHLLYTCYTLLHTVTQYYALLYTYYTLLYTIIHRSPDFYHTCYCLSGLSLAQHQIADPEFILGGAGNLLLPVDPKFNLVGGKAELMISYFASKSL